MIDARNVYRKVTRKIYDFTPEQLQNLTAIVWLHRGQEERFIHLVQYYIDQTLLAAFHCDTAQDLKTHPMPDCVKAIGKLHKAMLPFLSHLDTSLGNEGAHVEPAKTVQTAITKFQKEWTAFQKKLKTLQKTWKPEQYNTAKKLKPICRRGWRPEAALHTEQKTGPAPGALQQANHKPHRPL